MTIQTLSPRISTGSILGQALGQGVQTGLERGLNYQIQRSRLQNALSGLENLPAQSTPFQLASNLLQATAGIPGAERYVGQLFPLLLSQLQAQQSQNVPYPNEAPLPIQRQPLEPITERQQLPGFGQGTALAKAKPAAQFFPTNVPGQEAPGNIPQTATVGQKRQIFSADELIPKARELSKSRTAAGIPTTVPEALQEVKNINDENKLFNREVEAERQQRVQSQQAYGEKAANAILKLMPNATDEQQAIFRKIGEKAAGEFKSEADIDRHIAVEARKFKNSMANVSADLSAPRFQNMIHRKFLGTHKDINEATKDLEVKLRPMLDLGLYDTARKLLETKEYYPEEIESVINPLNERTQADINLVPKAKKIRVFTNRPGLEPAIPPGTGFREEYNPEQLQSVHDSIVDIFRINPNVSLVLMRKAFEDKGYDWRAFKNILNSTIQQNEIRLNDDQFAQLKYLDTPPLNTLQQILHGLRLIGR
jgi:hypothetical protein